MIEITFRYDSIMFVERNFNRVLFLFRSGYCAPLGVGAFQGPISGRSNVTLLGRIPSGVTSASGPVRRALVVMVMETCASGSQSFGVPVHAEWWHSDMVSLARWIEDLLVVVIVVPRWLHAVWWSFGGRQQHGHGMVVSRKSTVQ